MGTGQGPPSGVKPTHQGSGHHLPRTDTRKKLASGPPVFIPSLRHILPKVQTTLRSWQPFLWSRSASLLFES